MIGPVMGKVMVQKLSQAVEPSMLAASYMDSGMECRAARKMKICTPERIMMKKMLLMASLM